MDELNRKLRGPHPEFDKARRSPAMVLAGLAVGLVLAQLGALFFFPSAPVLPFLLGLAVIPFRGGMPFALGAWAAASGELVFVITLLVLLAL